MEASGHLIQTLMSPIVLAFVLGVVAALVKSDLRVPEQVHGALSMYLLLAVGLKGGVALSQTPFSKFAVPAIATLALGVATLLIAYSVLRKLGKLERADAAAIAAHYGSVSAVTFIATMEFARLAGATPEGFLPGLVAILEVPAIIGAIWLAKGGLKGGGRTDPAYSYG